MSTRRDDAGKVETFHFPKNKPEQNKNRISFVIRRDWSATSSSVICELHFQERIEAQGERDRLKWNLNTIPPIHPKPAQ